MTPGRQQRGSTAVRRVGHQERVGIVWQCGDARVEVVAVDISANVTFARDLLIPAHQRKRNRRRRRRVDSRDRKPHIDRHPGRQRLVLDRREDANGRRGVRLFATTHQRASNEAHQQRTLDYSLCGKQRLKRHASYLLQKDLNYGAVMSAACDESPARDLRSAAVSAGLFVSAARQVEATAKLRRCFRTCSFRVD